MNNPANFGILKYDKYGVPKKIIEKPKNNIGNDAVVGLYFYKNSALKYLNKLKVSKRGEFEITDFNNILLKKKINEFSAYRKRFCLVRYWQSNKFIRSF